MKRPQRSAGRIEPDEAAAPPDLPIAGGEADTEATPYHYVWWNFAAITFDVAFWSAGMACVDIGAVLPVFVSTLTGSKLVIAALTVLPGVGWTLPQLLGVSRIMHRPRKKGYLLGVAALGRSPMLVLPVLLLFFPPSSKALMLWVLVGCYGTLFLTDGLIGAAWYDIIGKTIPARVRGRFFGSMNILGGMGALGSGWLVRRVLASPHLAYPRQYGVLFACMCAGLLMSFLLLAIIREPRGVVPSERAQPLRDVLGQVPQIWRRSSPLRRLLAVSWLGGLAGLAWPFYVLHGMEALRLPTEAGAVFIWASAIGNMGGSLAWAWLNDRKGPRSLVVGVAALRPIPPALALAVPLVAGIYPQLSAPGVAQYVYAVVFLFSGAVMSGGMMGFANYLLELAPARERPLFMGLGNTLNAPGLLAPVLGGWLVSVWSYQGVFVIAAAVGVASVLVSLSLQVPTAQHHAAPYVPPEGDRSPR
jgi:hypothetical protein